MKKETKQRIASIGAVIVVLFFGWLIMLSLGVMHLYEKAENKVMNWVNK